MDVVQNDTDRWIYGLCPEPDEVMKSGLGDYAKVS